MRLLKFEIKPSSDEFEKHVLVNPEFVATLLARAGGGTTIVMSFNVYYNCVEDIGKVASRLLYAPGEARDP